MLFNRVVIISLLYTVCDLWNPRTTWKNLHYI